jgi:hypothetical protein
MMIPMITPYKPKALPKISTISILTKVDGVWACARAVLEPTTPTETPQTRFENPTISPDAKTT